MEALLLGLFIADIYLIVYYRLLIGQAVERNTGLKERGGVLRVLSLPPRSKLNGEGLSYYRRYWIAVAALLGLFALGVWLRYPAITQAWNT